MSPLITVSGQEDADCGRDDLMDLVVGRGLRGHRVEAAARERAWGRAVAEDTLAGLAQQLSAQIPDGDLAAVKQLALIVRRKPAFWRSRMCSLC
ncbi:hypothetical protein [Hyphomicrobium sp. CS1GBMeth3]|uniref:hypothetical protein n=1 Tax=Hyphomicrobium sp. CS1GBMeth3 TaxID=1892845 RepID=UPI000B2F8A5E|nr:hypothetical protein [Hyphomicrobium sp. CS1GBMeth3]